jgi:hypothetical protein
MVAIEGRTYMQAINGAAHWKFTSADLPEWNENDIVVVDITIITPEPQEGWAFSGGVFTAPAIPQYDLVKSKALKAKAISAACEQQILAGFTSSALGTAHTYPNNDRDQVNLSGSILRSTLPNTQPTDVYPFLCKDSNEVWEYQLHTAAQIQQVGTDSYNFILAARVKNATLQYMISQATNQAGLDSIVW